MKISTIINKNNRNYLIATLFWLTIWQLVSMILGQEILLVSPVLAIKKILELSLELDFWISIWSSFIKITNGFILAFIIGIIFAVVASIKEKFRILIEPLMATIQAIPVASFIILCLIWISSKNLSIVISFLMALPIVYRNILDGILGISDELKDMAKVFKVTNKKKIRYIYLSEVSPYLRTASSVALGLCWKSGIAAEIIGLAENSIGEKLYQAKIYLDTAELFAWTIVIIIVSVIFKKLFLFIINFFLNRLEIS